MHIEYLLKKGHAPKLVQDLKMLLAKELEELIEIRIKLLLTSASRFPANREEELSLIVVRMKKQGEMVPFFWEKELASLRCPVAPAPRSVTPK